MRARRGPRPPSLLALLAVVGGALVACNDATAPSPVRAPAPPGPAPTAAPTATPSATPSATPATTPPWWQTAVFYEIYPRSFQDSNGDGVGDLAGITQRLDYLAELGVGAIWITPFYPSPQVDFGYDVSDYLGVDPRYGTLADLDLLVREAHRRGIRVVGDLVVNHSSDRHRWFLASKASRTNAFRDYYVWKDPAPGGGPPNNWQSCFGGSAWQLDPATGQYYYHFFYTAQPDLNWKNPEVERAMFDVVRTWFTRGLDGFRLDAVNTLAEDPSYADNPPGHHTGGCVGEENQTFVRNMNRPEVHEILKRMRKVADEQPGHVLIGEAYVPLDDLVRYYGDAGGAELQLPFNFAFLQMPSKLDANAFRTAVVDTERALAGRWTTWVLDNHDNTRSWDRYGDKVHDDAIAKLLTTMLLTLRGTPFLYYGEELGMVTTDPARIEDVQDPVGRRKWPTYKGRDGERTPMQWSDAPHAGFTTGKPWLAVPPSASARNVATESREPTSMLRYAKALLALRRSTPALLEGSFHALDAGPDVFAYRRSHASGDVVVALNMSNASHRLPAPAACAGRCRVVLSNTRAPGPVVDAIELAPFEAVVVGGAPPQP